MTLAEDFARTASPFTLRTLQVRALEAVEAEPAKGRRRLWVSLPPGTGKTLLGLELVRRLGTPAVVLAPNTAIQVQWGDTWERFTPAIVATGTDRDLAAPVTVLTYQSLATFERTDDPDADDDVLLTDRLHENGRKLIAALRAAGHPIAVADLGGGLGVPYDPALAPPPSPADYGAMVSRVAGGWGVRLIFEPGRLIVGNAGVLLTRVIRIKPGAACPFVVVDAGMNDLLRPTLYDAWHAIEAVAPTPTGETMVADVVGPLCESGDSFAFSRTMDRVAAGDLLIVRSCGAYAATMAGTYNSRPLAPEVMVNTGLWAVVRERQDLDALTRGDTVPPWLSGG